MSKLTAAYMSLGCSFYIASGDSAKAAREQRTMLDVLVGEKGSEEKIKQFFFDKTRELMERESCTTVAKGIHTVDIVRSVLRVVPIYWACDMVRTTSGRHNHSVRALKLHFIPQAGIQLKTSADGEGDYTLQELFSILSEIYTYV